MPPLRRLITVASCVCTLAGCTVYNTTGITKTEETSSYALFALVDDTVWSVAAAPYGTTLLEGVLQVTATRTAGGKTVGSFTLYVPTGRDGIVPVGLVTNTGTVAATLYDNSSSTEKSWSTRDNAGDGGSATITTWSSTLARGTFNFILYAPASQSTGPQTRHVSGQFNFSTK